MLFKRQKDPRIETPLGKIPPEHLAVAQGIARRQSTDEIADRLGIDSGAVYGSRSYWRGLLQYRPQLRQSLCESIRQAVTEHGLDRIDVSGAGRGETRSGAGCE